MASTALMKDAASRNMEAKMKKACAKYQPGMNVSKLASEFSVARSTLAYRLQRLSKDTPVRKHGREPFLLESDIAELQQEAKIRTRQLNCFSRDTLKLAIIAKGRESLTTRGLNDDRISNITDTTLAKYINQIGLLDVKKPSVQNERRFQVAKDPRNAISLAATYGAILGDPSDPDRPVPSTIFNVDVTSLNLGEAIVETALADGEEQEVLKRKGLNASQTKNEKKYRTAKVMTLISAQGTLDATIVIIKDDTLKQERLFSLRKGCGCIWFQIQTRSRRRWTPPL